MRDVLLVFWFGSAIVLGIGLPVILLMFVARVVLGGCW